MAENQHICQGRAEPCATPHECSKPGQWCRYLLLPPIGCLHFVGFKDERYWKPDERFWNAVRTFGYPDIMHRTWDARAQADIDPDWDVVVFAEGDENTPPSPHGFDDSHADIVANGGDDDR
jgi:hypothetical protein